ncbi:MAG: AAA family ATPase [Methanobacteriaceae archaeon]|nr:AAA family ATPase [Methanobacteriaceae archaeon]
MKAKTRKETTKEENISDNKDILLEPEMNYEDSKEGDVSKTSESTKITKPESKKLIKPEILNSSRPSNDISGVIDTQSIKTVGEDVKKNPRITLWSSRSAAVLRYLKKTQPEFSISKEASKLIEEAVKEKYPEIWDIFEDL